MHIRGKRRTQQIDDDREKLIGWGPLGPIHTTQGANKLSGDEREELSAALSAKRRYHDVQIIKTKVQEAAAGFFETTILKMAPQPIVDDYWQNGPTTGFVDWLVKSGFKCQIDGLVCIVLRNGVELARTTAKVPLWYHDEVLVALRVDQMVEKGSNGG